MIEVNKWIFFFAFQAKFDSKTNELQCIILSLQDWENANNCDQYWFLFDVETQLSL